MKKVLAMALGAVMVSGGATAGAASHIEFSGFYRINYMLNANRTFASEPQSFTDQYFDDRLQLNMIYSPTDEISVHWGLRGPDRPRWGTGDSKNVTSKYIYGEIKQDWGNVLVGRLSDDLDAYGLASLGYQPSFGPFVNVGPFDRSDVVDGIRYANRWDNGLGLMVQYAKMNTNYTSTRDVLGNNVYDAAGNLIGSTRVSESYANSKSDQDFDRVQAEVSYHWDGGAALLGLMFDRDAASGNYQGTPQNYDNGRSGSDWRNGRNDSTTAVFINPAFMQTWGEFSLHFEGMAGWGRTKLSGPVSAVTQTNGIYGWAKPDRRLSRQDSDGYGAYLDFDYNYGPGHVNLAAWWVSGSDLNDKESGSLVDIAGGNFYPLLVSYGAAAPAKFRSPGVGGTGNAMGTANNAFENFIAPAFGGFGNNPAFINDSSIALGQWVGGAGAAPAYFSDTWGLAGANNSFNHGRKFVSRTFNENTDANHWAVSVSGDHSLNDDVTLHYALAYLSLNNPNYRVVSSASYGAASADHVFKYKEQDKDLGVEGNLGLRFKLLDNLTLTSTFGYMISGDAYKELRGYTIAGAAAGAAGPTGGEFAKAKWRDADDVYVWYNTLQFDF